MKRLSLAILALSLAGCAAPHLNEQVSQYDSAGRLTKRVWIDYSDPHILIEASIANAALPTPDGTLTLNGVSTHADPQVTELAKQATDAIRGLLAVNNIAVGPALAAQMQTVAVAAISSSIHSVATPTTKPVTP